MEVTLYILSISSHFIRVVSVTLPKPSLVLSTSFGLCDTSKFDMMAYHSCLSCPMRPMVGLNMSCKATAVCGTGRVFALA